MRMTITTRLLGSFIVMLLLLVAVGGLALYNLNELNKLNTDVYEREFVAVSHTERMRTASERHYNATILAVTALNDEERDNEIERRTAAATAFISRTNALEALLINDDTINLVAQLRVAWSNYATLSDAALVAAQSGDAERAVQLIHTTGRAEREQLETLTRNLVNAKEQTANASVENALEEATYSRNLILAILAVALLIGIGITVWLRRLTGIIRAGTQDLASTSNELLASVTQQEASTSEQAAAVGQTTATVDEVRITAQQSSQKARDVANMAQTAAEVAADGMRTVETSVYGMESIRSRVEAIAEQMLALSEQTQQVGEIIATVDDIADQSNLLAVNAAIEASRAGEQGRGFAVVAQEVRSLAERSKAATVQVRAILTDIQRATNAAVLATEQGQQGAEEAAQLVEQAGNTIRKLATTIQHAAEAAQQILASSGQQSVGMDQIAMAMANINQATTETAASSRQLQRAAENMTHLAGRMTTLVGRERSNGHR